jgi:molybdopterin-containing oxidoreductase family iron-sulfur binding subunit
MDTLSRRDLFKIIGTAGAAAGASSCGCLVEELAPGPPVRRRVGPQKQVATMCGGCSAGCGISVRLVGDDASRITGVAGHPVNDGGLCPRGVAETQNLYHPDRLQGAVEREGDRGSGNFKTLAWDAAIDKVVQGLSGTVLIAVGAATALEMQLLRKIAAKTGAQIVPVGLSGSMHPASAYELFFGTSSIQPDFANADLVVSLGSDWLQSSDSPVEAQRTYARLRGGDRPIRIITADGRLSVTASRSDAWVPVPQSGLGLFALALARGLAAADAGRGQRLPGLATLLSNDRLSPEAVARSLDIPQRSLERTVQALQSARHPVILVDGAADVPTQVAAVALQIIAGDAGAGILRSAEPALPPALAADARVASALSAPAAGAAVLLFGANPLFVQPKSAWGETIKKAKFVAAVTPFPDESAGQADVVLASSSALESRQLTWGTAADGKPFVSGGPAAVKPLYQTLESVEILTRLAHGLDSTVPWKSADDLFDAIKEPLGAGKILDEGGFARPEPPAAPALAVVPESSARAADILRGTVSTAAPGFGSLQLQTYVPLAYLGGTGAHLPFLHGITSTGGREIWRTVVEMHPRAAERVGIADSSPVVVETSQGRIHGVVRLREGIRPDTVAIAVGLGRTAGGRWAAGYGDNPLTLAAPGETAVGVVVRRV